MLDMLFGKKNQNLATSTADAAAEKNADMASILDLVPTAAIKCDTDFKITYANKRSIETLKELRDLISVDPEKLIGESIDIFHKNPAHQRGILSDSSNFPFSSIITLGTEKLDLYVQEVISKTGAKEGYLLTWSVVTDKLKAKAAQNRLERMIDDIPTPVMMADRDFNITYMNATSLEKFQALRNHLPVAPEEIVGSNIDVFHKQPAHQRSILSDPKNLPHRAVFNIGPELIDLRASAVNDADGNYIGPMVTWNIRTHIQSLEEEFEQNIGSLVADAENNSSRLGSIANSLKTAAHKAKDEGSSMKLATSAALTSIETVAAATEEMSSSAAEIARQISFSTEKTQETDGVARKTSDTIQELNAAAIKIGDVVSIINDIAEQTNLLALNATIEAARAGEAGKGFAVVASEVKSLASETAKATGDISEQITKVQEVSSKSVEAIQSITRAIGDLRDVSQSIASAAEEQRSSTEEIARSVQEAAGMTGNLDASVEMVLAEFDLVENATNEVDGSLENIQSGSRALKTASEKFLGEVKKL